jgi:hypothetical protein
MDASGAKTSAPDAYGKATWFWRLDAGVKSATMLSHRAGDGDKQPITGKSVE